MATKPKGAGGRPNQYETKVKPHLDKIGQWAGNGITEISMAKSLGISQDTFIQYKKKFPELVEALKRGNEIVDAKVENALLKRALGFEYDEITQEKSGDTVTKTKVTRKQIVPDVGAQAFWLKNRKPEIWKERHEVGIETIGDEAQTELREYLQELKNEKE